MYIPQLTHFFNAAVADERLTVVHIGLYLALFECWNLNNFINPVHVCRKKLMLFSKINSRVTYHKCMKELQQYGYIVYKPSYHPVLGSEVHFKFQAIG
jgi:hypothetical protein